MWLVVGLGNPGAKYQDTRHNAGFLVVDEVARRWRVSQGKAPLGATTGQGEVARSPVLLAQPQRYMNRSGGPVGALQRFHDVPIERVVVVHDELDLPFGTVRIKRGGGHGGHNGLRDLHEHVGTELVRVRVGVSRPPEGVDAADWVLSAWSEDEREALAPIVERGADAVEAIIADGPIHAMNSFNVRPRRRAEPTPESEPSAGAVDDPPDGTDLSDAGPSQPNAHSGQGAE